MSRKRHDTQIIRDACNSDQIASKLLLAFDSFEQRLEVSSAEAREVVTLDNFNEYSWPVHEMFGEQPMHASVSREQRMYCLTTYCRR